MNPDSPKSPREELEAKLTALLLGELPAEEADALRQAIERDATLSGLYDRLKHAIDLVGEVTAGQPEQTTVQPPPLKLGQERRQILLTHFKTIAPREFAMPSRRDWSWIVPLGAAAAAVLVLAAIALPNFTRARATGRSNAIMNNLRQLDGAKQQWALERRKSATDVPTLTDLKSYMKEGGAPSVAGETYRLGTVGESPTAELKRGERIQQFSLLNDAQLASAKKGVSEPGFAGRSKREMAAAKPPESIAVSTPPPAQLAPPPAQNTARRTVIVLPGAGEATDASADRLETPLFHADPNKISEALRDVGTPPSVNLAQNATGGDIGGGLFGGVANQNGTPGVPQVIAAASAATGVPGPVTFSASKEANSQTGPALGGEEPATTPAPGEGAANAGLAASAQPDLSIEAKFAETSQKDASALAFDWYNKNVTEGKSNLGAQGGSSRAIDRDPLALRGFYESNAERPAALPSVTTTSGREAGRQTSVVDGFADIALEPGAVPTVPALGVTGLPKEPEVALALSKENNQAIAQKPGEAPVLGNVPAVGTLFRANGVAADVENKQTFALALPPEIQPTGKDSSNPREVEHGIRARDELDLALAQSPNGQKSKSTESALILPAISANGAVKQYTWSASQETQRMVEKPKFRAEREFQTGVTQEQVAEKVGRLPSKEIVGPEVSATKQARESAIGQADEDRPIRRPAPDAPIPQPEVLTRENAFSTFSLNVSDVSFKIAAASLEKGRMPDPASVRGEEFINAFDYRDPEPPPGVPVAFNWERARYPFAQNRDLLRFSIKTAAAGRQPGRPLNLVLLLDNSGSMERADRVQIVHEALRVLAGQLQARDRISVVAFARTARLWADGLSGDQAGAALEQAGGITPQGGTNLEEAMRLAYETALRHYLATGMNRVVLLTDGAANLGNVDPEALRQKVENYRKRGIALDCFGVGWEGYNDDLLEVLSSNGDGRYGFLNSPEEATTRFAGQLAGAFKVAAADVKVQVEFNPGRVTAYRQIGYAKHQLTKEQFRDNTVDAAEIGAAEAGNALYTVEVNPQGEGPLATVRVRYKVPGTSDYREPAWDVPFTGNTAALDQASPAMRLAATSAAFSEWLVASPFAAEVTPDALLGYLSGVPDVYGADERPKKLEWMMRQAKSIGGK